MKPSRRDLTLTLTLLALAGLFGYWFRADPHRLAIVLVFVMPPLVLAAGTLLGRATARFWAGVLALFWFSHGVMRAWSTPAEAALAAGEIVLALAVIALVSLPGLRARFARR